MTEIDRPRRIGRYLLPVLLWIAGCAVFSVAADRWVVDRIVDERTRVAELRALALAQQIDAEFRGVANLAHALSLRPELAKAILARPTYPAGPDNRETRRGILEADPALGDWNRQLAALIVAVRADLSFVLAADGTCVASANAGRPESCVGEVYTDRRYFKEAMATGVGTQFAVGRLTNTPAFFFAHSVQPDPAAAPVGVVIVRQSARELAALVGELGEAAVVTDEAGVVVMSSSRDLLFRHLSLADTPRPDDAMAAATYKQSRIDDAGLTRREIRGHVVALRDGMDMVMAKAAIPGTTYQAWVSVPLSSLTLARTGMLVISLLAGLAGALLTVAIAGLMRALRLARKNERLQAERLADETAAAARLDAILASVRESILTATADGVVLTANRAAIRLFGAPSLAGRSLGDLLARPGSPPDPFPLDPDALAGIQEHGCETQARRDDGTVLPVELSLSRSADGTTLTLSVRDITARKEVERLKDEFVATVSHELRTPLTSIRGALGLIQGLSGAELSPKTAALIEMAKRNTERLTALVNDILDIEKIEAGRLEFQLADLDLAAAAGEAVDANRTYAGGAKVRLALSIPGDPVPVRADPQRLQQVLANLISNAVKFSPDGQTVGIDVSVDGGWARLSVRDRGPGVPAAFRDRIFQKFAQANAADNRSKAGTGLGLAVSKAIVEQLGGGIGYDSRPGDTSFWIVLPLLRPAAPTTPDTDGADARHRVLVCEDDPDIARLLRFMVERGGQFSVDTVGTAAAARQALFRTRYHALLLDLGLPDEDGIALFRGLRADPRHRALPVIVVSARAEQGRQVLNGDAVGILDWIQKPVDEERLAAALLQVDAPGVSGRLPRILHVEDDPDVAGLVSRLLDGKAAVEMVPSLAAARTALAASPPPDLVLLDLGLGDGQGLDLLPQIAGLRPQPQVLVFSGQEAPRALADRLAGVLVKTRTSESQLVDTILHLVGRGVPARPGV